MLGTRQGEVDIILTGSIRAVAGIDARTAYQNRLSPIGRSQGYNKITNPSMTNIDGNFDLINIDVLGDIDGAGDAGTVVIGNCPVWATTTADFDRIMIGALSAPGFGKSYSVIRINKTKSVIMTEMKAAAVPVTRIIIIPARIATIRKTGGIDQDFLNITISERFVSFEHQGNYARCYRC